MAWPVPAWVGPTLATSHSVRARLTASVSGSGFAVPLPLVSGTVTIDARSPARRQLKATVLADPDDPAVSPYTAEVRAEYGVVRVSGEVEWVPVGTFVITDADEAEPGVVSITAVDRWQRIMDARLERPVATSGDTVEAITALLQAADDRIVVDATGAPTGSHGSALWERDRGEAITNLARTIGALVYFDPMGVARIAPAPSLLAAPAWQINAGPGGVKVRARRALSRARTYNAAVVIGEPPDRAPVYGVARDGDEASLTRYGGPFGKRPRFLRSQLVLTQAQAQAAADAMLVRNIGRARAVSVETLPNPTLEAGDVVLVETVPGRYERHLLETWPLQLGLGTTLLGTRSTASEETEGE